MVLSMTKLVDVKRKKWQSKLQHTKSQRCLPVFSRVFSSFIFRKKQGMSGKNPSRSETTLAVEIPDDLVEEIRHRLPVKSLVRLKSVSKGWESLNESSHLVEKHLRLRQKKNGVEEMKITFEWSIPRSFCIKYCSKYRGLGASNRKSESFLRVAGPCNGLVFVYDLVYVYLVNPTTRIIRTLAPPQGNKLSVGFGRDVVTGIYKVVILYDRVETIVFELGTNEWRWRHKTAGPMPHPSSTRISPERNPVFVYGSLFWLLTPNHLELLVMDLHTEKYRTLLQPKDISTVSSSGFIYMWSMEDRLCACDIRKGSDSYVWVLVQEEVSERWERTRFAPVDTIIPPLQLTSAWFSQSLVSPYQSSSHF